MLAIGKREEYYIKLIKDALLQFALHKKWSLLLWVSSENVTNSAGFAHIY